MKEKQYEVTLKIDKDKYIENDKDLFLEMIIKAFYLRDKAKEIEVIS